MTRTRRPSKAPLIYERAALYAKQEAAIFAPERYAIIEATPKSGKTVGCMAWLLEQAVQGRPNSHYWWVAPIAAQAEIAFRRFVDGLPRDQVVTKRTTSTIQLPNRATLWFKSGDTPDSLYGEDVRAVVIDEAP